eukprot:CAMPEP_0194393314 /NCGR_PEP_ID=MMETSP0174-20130528/123228_1 /TAXON_ID=216777 /ORGANISM="Proboscia alata, Strain PI-D3" /LENGTH=629 /DNA_ID=CAMNT_0039188983 /DNA_START=1112 /DNA_END=3001 /DNA_ORIENTATION=+
MSRISQEYYDETVLENEETFELSPDEAIAETISQLASQLQLGDNTNDNDGAAAAALSDLILISHPHSEEGLMERKRHVGFVSLLTRLDEFVQPNAITGVIDVNELNVGTCVDSIEQIQTVCETSNERERYRSILEREMGLLTLQSLLSCSNERVVSSSLACLGSLMQNTFCFREDFKAFDRLVSILSNHTHSRDSTILQRALTLATVLCTKCEPNKNSFLRAKAVYQRTKMNTPPTSGDAPGGSAVLLQNLSTWLLTTPPPAASNMASDVILGHCCNLVASLCKYDDFRAESSSANETASMFYRAGIVPLLMNGNTNDDTGNRRSVCAVAFQDSYEGIELQISAMAAVRALCVNDDIVQSFVAGGVLELVAKVLKETASLLPTNEAGTVSTCDTSTPTAKQQEEARSRKRLLSITLGVIRNLCGNDTIKTNLCQDEITLPLIVSTMTARTASPSPSTSATNNKKTTTSLWAGPTMLEHSCGILAAMSLRSPTNANLILTHHGSTAITSAMAQNPNCVPVLRQGCLAIRNLVSRNKENIPKLLDSSDNLELVLRDVAGKQQGSVDEAYAALRDLGLSAKLITIGDDGAAAPQSSVAMFGDTKPRFRPVFDESDDMEGRIQNHIDVSRGPT